MSKLKLTVIYHNQIIKTFAIRIVNHNKLYFQAQSQYQLKYVLFICIVFIQKENQY